MTSDSDDPDRTSNSDPTSELDVTRQTLDPGTHARTTNLDTSDRTFDLGTHG